MTFGRRMIAIALFPLGFLLLYVLMTGSNALDDRSKAAATVEATEYVSEFSQLIHDLQKERGMSAGFVGSKGAAFGDALRDQRALVDQTLPNVVTSIQAMERTAPEYVERYSSMIEMLTGTRERINAQDVTVPELAGYYSGTIRSLFDLTKLSTSDLKNA
jgi:methyl-accepting chemotaxis protein